MYLNGEKTTDKIKPTYVDFDHDNYKWKSDIDYRKNPHYIIGRGQQGVLTCEPYKSELHPLWRFKTPEKRNYHPRIINKFFGYLEENDFVEIDIRSICIRDLPSRRYWNHSSGKKWEKVPEENMSLLHYHLLNLTNGKFYHMIEQKKDSISL